MVQILKDGFAFGFGGVKLLALRACAGGVVVQNFKDGFAFGFGGVKSLGLGPFAGVGGGVGF